MTRSVTLLAFVLFAASISAEGQPPSPKTLSAAKRMQQDSPQRASLRARVGKWEVTAMMWPSPGATPVTTKGLIAERNLVGTILQEVMKPAAGTPGPDFQRLDYL